MMTMRIRVSSAITLALLLLLALGAGSCEARSIQLAPGHPDESITLTHAEGYEAPPVPDDIAAWTQRALHQSRQLRTMSTMSASGGPAPQLPYCDTCQVVIQVAEWVAQNSSAMSLVEVLLDDLCDKFAGADATCTAVVKEIIKFGKGAPALLKHLGLYEPLRLCSFFSMCSVSCCSDDTTPTQIHLGAGSDCTEMHVSWVTGGSNTQSQVVYGIDALDQSASGYQFTYSEGGWLGTIHRVVLTGLQCGATYTYAVGGAGAQSAKLNFRAWNDLALETPFRLAITGDMGATENQWSTQNIAWLNNATRNGHIHGVIHAGDVSYANGYMAIWDSFFTQLEPTMSQVPYQVVPGNHELLFNFTAFKSRFFMSGIGAAPAADGLEPSEGSIATPSSLTHSTPSATNLYSSWDAGCVHFVGICSEDNFNQAYIGEQQLEWLTKDLEAAAARRDAGAARRRAQGLTAPTECSVAEPTFLVAYMHRPLYCTNRDSSNCQGRGATYLASRVEELFKRFAVDLVFAGHLHDMRTHPVYNGTLDASGPVYIVNGAGGNREGVSTNWVEPTPVWSAMQGGVAGVGTLTVVNASALVWEFYRQNNGTDQVTLIDQMTLHARDPTTRMRKRTPVEEVEDAEKLRLF